MVGLESNSGVRKRNLGVFCLGKAAATASLLAIGWLAAAPSAWGQEDAFARTPLDRIPPGTVIGAMPPKGWTHLIIVSKPRLASGDIKSAGMSAPYVSLLNLCLLANVTQVEATGRREWRMEKVAIGLSKLIGGRNTVITVDTQAKLGAGMGFIEKQVLSENEKYLEDVFYVARTPNMAVFDAKAIILHDGEHRELTMRHAVIVSPESGALGTMVWLLKPNGKGGYAEAETTLQFLPPNLQEDRKLNVDAAKIRFGIPGKDAFAMQSIPQGTPLAIDAPLRPWLVPTAFTAESASRLEAELWRTLAGAGIK